MRTETQDRLVSGAGAVAVTALFGALLVAGLTVRPREAGEAALVALDLKAPPPPPKPKPPEPVHGYRAAKAAGAPAPKAKATPVLIPPPIVPLPAPPVVAAPKPATGVAAASGGLSRGMGTGAGGEGDGPGGGGAGGEGDDTPPQEIGGALRWSDLPADRRDAATSWRVWVEYGVGVDGRVFDCRVTRSSGDRAIDDAFCAAMARRLHFRPARDRDGRAFAATMENWEYIGLRRERSDDDEPPPPR